MGDVGNEIAPGLFHPLNFGDVAQYAHHASIGKGFSSDGEGLHAQQRRHNRALAAAGMERGLQRIQIIRMAH